MKEHETLVNRLLHRILWVQRMTILLMLAAACLMIGASGGRTVLLPDAWEKAHPLLPQMVGFIAYLFVIFLSVGLDLLLSQQRKSEGFIPYRAIEKSRSPSREPNEAEARIFLPLSLLMERSGARNLYEKARFRIRPVESMGKTPAGANTFFHPVAIFLREDVMQLHEDEVMAVAAHEYGHLALPYNPRSALAYATPLMVVALLLQGPAWSLWVVPLAYLPSIVLASYVNITHEHLADAFAARIVGGRETARALVKLHALQKPYAQKELWSTFWKRCVGWITWFVLVQLWCPDVCISFAVFTFLVGVDSVKPTHPFLHVRLLFLKHHFEMGESHVR